MEKIEKCYGIYDDMVIIDNLDEALKIFEELLYEKGLWEYYYTEDLNSEWSYSPENENYYLVSEELIKRLENKKRGKIEKKGERLFNKYCVEIDEFIERLIDLYGEEREVISDQAEDSLVAGDDIPQEELEIIRDYVADYINTNFYLILLKKKILEGFDLDLEAKKLTDPSIYIEGTHDTEDDIRFSAQLTLTEKEFEKYYKDTQNNYLQFLCEDIGEHLEEEFGLEEMSIESQDPEWIDYIKYSNSNYTTVSFLYRIDKANLFCV
jgi:hypothetical protein